MSIDNGYEPLTGAPPAPPNQEPKPLNTDGLSARLDGGLVGVAGGGVGVRLAGKASALDVQVGGDHYKKLKIQPVEYNMANDIPFVEGNVIKYVTRWRDKQGIKDLKKARHFLDILIEEEEKFEEQRTNIDEVPEEVINSI